MAHTTNRIVSGPLASFAACAALACAANAAPPVGLIAHLTFDQTGAGVALDSAGSNHGTLLGSAAMVAGGVSNSALQLTVAGGGMADLGTFNPTAGTTPCTITMWIKQTGTLTNTIFPVSKHQAGSLNGFFFCVGTSACYGSPGKFWSYRSNSCGSETIATTNVNDGQWHFIAMTFHLATGNRVYVDGGLREATGGAFATIANSVKFLLGGITVGATPTPVYDGMIDDMQVYGHALTCAEINYLYNNPGQTFTGLSPDVNGDGEVDGADLGILLSTWGTSNNDLNFDGITDGADLGILLGAWGGC